jgi:hypothetical protein
MEKFLKKKKINIQIFVNSIINQLFNLIKKSGDMTKV